MTDVRIRFAPVDACCLAALLLGVSVSTVFQEPDLYLYARLRKNITAHRFVDPPKNRNAALYYVGDEPEIEVILVNETGKEITLSEISTNMITPVLVKVPSKEWMTRLQFRPLREYAVWTSGQRQTALRTTRASLQPNDTLSFGFQVVTGASDTPPPGDYEIEVNCKLTEARLKRVWTFQNRLEFEIREPKTLAEKVSYLSVRALRYLDVRMDTQAEETIKQALGLYPLHSAGYSILARIRQNQARYPDAIMFYQRAIELLATRQDYLGTRDRSDNSIQDEIGIMKATINSLQTEMRRSTRPSKKEP